MLNAIGVFLDGAQEKKLKELLIDKKLMRLSKIEDYRSEVIQTLNLVLDRCSESD